MELYGVLQHYFIRKYHKLLVKTHLDFIKAGAEVIVTNSFGSRKRRLIENKLGHKFKELNETSWKISKRCS
jgi:homocysteine S-methyltransferase